MSVYHQYICVYVSLYIYIYIWQYPLGHPIHQLLRTISLLGRWSTSGSDRGIAHFFIATKNTIKGVGEKEQTNNMLGLIQAQEEELCNIAFPNASVDFKRNFFKATRNANPSWPVFPYCSGPYLMPTGLSAVRCRLATRVTLRQLPSLSSLVQLVAFPYPLPVTSRSRQNRQRDRLLGGPPT